MKRYGRLHKVSNGKLLGTSILVPAIRTLIREGRLRFDVKVIAQGERLDQVAANAYGDGKLWWIIAAASEVGWGMQLPPGTYIRIPKDLSVIEDFLG